MKIRKALYGALAAAVAASAMAVTAHAEAVEKGIFIIGVADVDWKLSFWGKANDESGVTSALQSCPKLEGNGTYTCVLDLSSGYTKDGWVDEDTGDLLTLTTANSIAAMGIQIYGDYPTLACEIKSVKFDGVEVPMSGTSFTNDEDGGRRTNIYNAWASFDSSASGNISVDPATATTTLIDPGDVGEWSVCEVTFQVYGMDAAPEEAEQPAQTETSEEPATSAGDVDAATDSSKGSPDTGAADVAVAAGLAIVAAGAVIVSKKRK